MKSVLPENSDIGAGMALQVLSFCECDQTDTTCSVASTTALGV